MKNPLSIKHVIKQNEELALLAISRNVGVFRYIHKQTIRIVAAAIAKGLDPRSDLITLDLTKFEEDNPEFFI